MNQYDALQIVDGLTESEPEEQLEAWQYLVDSGAAWTLPGCYGRTAAALIEAGEITP